VLLACVIPSTTPGVISVPSRTASISARHATVPGTSSVADGSAGTGATDDDGAAVSVSGEHPLSSATAHNGTTAAESDRSTSPA
jgi:hypothetical protein